MYKIVIVDDDAFIRNQLYEIFDWRGMGYMVSGCFGSADEAIDFMAKNPVDVLFSDIRLGGETGLDLARRAHEICPEIEVVLISAYSEFEYAHDAIKLSVFDYLQKPVTYNNVTECFAKLRQKLNMVSKRTDNLINHINLCIGNMDYENAYMLAKLYLRDAGGDIGDIRPLLYKLAGALCSEDEEKHSEVWENIHKKIEATNNAAEMEALAVEIVGLAISCQDVEYEYYQIELVKQYIAGHYNDNIKLEDVAYHVNMNPAYLSRYFKKHTGEKFIDYLSQVRIDNAKMLLIDPCNKIYDICEMVGYRSKHHFYNVFKQQTGMTPSEYRNRITPNNENIL